MEAKLSVLESARQDTLDMLALSAEPFETEVFLHQVVRHRLGGLLYVDPEFRADPRFARVEEPLAVVYARTVKLQFLAARVLTEFLSIVSSAGIRCLLLKGAALMYTKYQGVGVRPMHDIDLFVDQSSIARLDAALAGHGYQCLDDNGGTEHQRHRAYEKSDVVIEVHWKLTDRSLSATLLDEIWSEARHISIDGCPAAVLSPRHQLLHLCAHREWHHYQCSLLGLFDVSTVLPEAAQDWSSTVACANQWGVQTPLFITLEEVRRHFEVDLDAGMLDAIGIPMWRRCLIRRHLASGLRRRAYLNDRPDYLMLLCTVGRSAFARLRLLLAPPVGFLRYVHPQMGKASVPRLYAFHYRHAFMKHLCHLVRSLCQAVRPSR